MGLSREENLLDLTPHDHGMECGSGRLFAFVALRAWRESALNYGAPRTKSRWLTATYFWLVLPIPVLSIHDLSTVRSGYGPLMKVSARSAGGQVCILHLARFNDFPGTKIVAIEPVQKTKPREKMAYFSLTAKLEWLTLVRPAATAGAHSRSRNAFGEETLTSCLTRVGGPEIGWGVRQ